MQCVAHGCVFERVTLRRDGHATREWRTGDRLDSTFIGRFDTTAFAVLARAFIATEFFAGRDMVDTRHQPLQLQSILVSAGTNCRRKVRAEDRSFGRALGELRVVASIDSLVSRAIWIRTGLGGLAAP